MSVIVLACKFRDSARYRTHRARQAPRACGWAGGRVRHGTVRCSRTRSRSRVWSTAGALVAHIPAASQVADVAWRCRTEIISAASDWRSCNPLNNWREVFNWTVLYVHSAVRIKETVYWYLWLVVALHRILEVYILWVCTSGNNSLKSHRSLRDIHHSNMLLIRHFRSYRITRIFEHCLQDVVITRPAVSKTRLATQSKEHNSDSLKKLVANEKNLKTVQVTRTAVNAKWIMIFSLYFQTSSSMLWSLRLLRRHHALPPVHT